MPALDSAQQEVLRQVGREWTRVSPAPGRSWRGLPLDPDLGRFPLPEEVRPTRFDRLVRVAHSGRRPSGEPYALPSTAVSRWGGLTRRTLLGSPLKSTALVAETMRKLVALPVLSADALSSVAYGPEALLAVLVLAGTAGTALSLPVASAIAFMMLAVGLSYRQTIRAYPHGGGSYIVADDNLGRMPGLVAAAGLMTDYVLTVAVSIASGVAAITSALPALASDTVPIGMAVIAVLLAGNLRGIRQAGALFALPTYAFIVAVFAIVGAGLADAAGRGFHPLPAHPAAAAEGVGILLVMRAFASGATAMTGIEAISNAVPAFKPVQWRNARTTLTWMIGLLIALFAGTVGVVHLSGIVPGGSETVLSQLAHHSFGSGAMYVGIQTATAAVLLLAANTAYNDFPRVLYLLARAQHAPRLFLRLGDRLAFSNGIILLSVAAALIYAVFSGDTSALIPLYAVGVFLAFTLSQTGMVVHWWRVRAPHWRKSLFFNAVGALLSALVLVTAAITKFTEGAWVVIVAVTGFLLVTTRIRRHYDAVNEALRPHPHAIELPLAHPVPTAPAPPTAPGPEGSTAATATVRPAADRTRETAEGVAGAGPGPGSGPGPGAGTETGTGTGAGAVPEGTEDESAEGEGAVSEGEGVEAEEAPQAIHHLSVVPVAALDLAGLRALAYAASLHQPTLALHISPHEEEARRFRGYWDLWGDHVPLEVVVSPYRATVAPLVHYVETLHHRRPDLTVTIVVPEIVTRRRRDQLLHGRTAPRLRRALRPLPKVVITSVPFHVRGAQRSRLRRGWGHSGGPAL
ncbi:APC family permease [Streptomyces axinellae]|uniref:Amino acid permease n=1 Tax=Streptomyces axinellae TaxID=552788 RepID=A0ABP6BYF0_9ACTN